MRLPGAENPFEEITGAPLPDEYSFIRMLGEGSMAHVFLVTIWGLIIAGSLIAARTANKYFHAAWAVIFFLIMSTVEFVNFSTLRAD